MTRQFNTIDELLNEIFDFLTRREDLLPMMHEIRYALKKDSKSWELGLGYTGVVFPLYKNEKNYTFQIITHHSVEDYQNITVYKEGYEKFDSVQGKKSLRCP